MVVTADEWCNNGLLRNGSHMDDGGKPGHGQSLLMNEYRSDGLLHDALHIDDEFKKKLPWNARIRMARLEKLGERREKEANRKKSVV
ncbi:hypothetical protein ACFX2J_027489 [Malus domestica]